MNIHDLYGATVSKGAWLLGCGGAASSGLYAAVTAPNPDVASGGVYIGIGSLVMAAMGLVVQVIRLQYADRAGEREERMKHDAAVIERDRMASSVVPMQAEIIWYRGQLATRSTLPTLPIDASAGSPMTVVADHA